jgi:hypothetical protein
MLTTTRKIIGISRIGLAMAGLNKTLQRAQAGPSAAR